MRIPRLLSIIILSVVLFFIFHTAVSGKIVSDFEKYAFNPQKKLFVCFLVMPRPGNFSNRFMKELLEKYYGNSVAIVGMGVWNERNWYRKLNIPMDSDTDASYFPVLVLTNSKGEKLGLLNKYQATVDITNFFKKYLPLAASEKKIPEEKFNTIYNIDRLLSPYEQFSQQKYLDLQQIAKRLDQKFSGYQTLEWLKAVSCGMSNFGQKTSRYNLRREVLPIVKIAPDTASFYRELANWNRKAIYPVLLGNNQWSIKFIRAFKPEKIIQLKPGKDISSSSKEVILHALTGKSGASPADANQWLATKMNGVPTGLVILDPDNAAAPAGTALAAARYQQVMFYKSCKEPMTRLSFTEADKIRKELIKFLESGKIPYKSYGTDLDGVTIACTLPFRYNAAPGEAEQGVRVVDDLITRNDCGAPWGAAGRLLGDCEYMVYQAMCSIFLQPEEALFFARYSESSAPWKYYSPSAAADLYSAYMPQRSSRMGHSTLKNWETLTGRGNTASEVFINSSGGWNLWSVSGGNLTAASINDSVPCKVHIIHSGSASAPLRRDSILRRWMDAGAYVYFGSMAEPLLEAFVTPTRIARRQLNGYPFGMACRSLAGPYSFPWRLICIGDPLTPLFNGAHRVAVEKAPVFDAVYSGSWNAVMLSLQSKKIASERDFNLWLLANAELGNVNEVMKVLAQKMPYPLWLETENRVMQLLRKQAAAIPEKKNKYILTMACVSNADSVIARCIAVVNELPIGARDKVFFSLLAGKPVHVQQFFVKKRTEAFLKSKPSLEQIKQYIAMYSNKKTMIKEVCKAIGKYLLTSPEILDHWQEVVPLLESPGFQAAGFKAEQNYVSIFNLLWNAGKIKEAGTFYREHAKVIDKSKAAAIPLMLLRSRRETPQAAAEIIDAFLKKQPDSPFKACLEDEKGILLQQTPQRKCAFIEPGNSKAVSINGQLMPGEWSKAACLMNNKPSDGKNKLYILIDDKYLYMAGEFMLDKGQKAVVNTRKNNGPVWADESIELFFDHNRDYTTVRQIAINPAGIVFDNFRMNGKMKRAAKLDNEKWSFEAAIPMNLLFPAGLQNKTVIGFNAIRNSPGSKTPRTSWNPACRNQNHNAKQYGYLIIDRKKP